MSDSNCSSERVSYATSEEDCTGGLVMEVFDDSDKVGTDVVLFFMDALNAACQTLSKVFLTFYEDMVEVLLVLEILFTKESCTPPQKKKKKSLNSSSLASPVYNLRS